MKETLPRVLRTVGGSVGVTDQGPLTVAVEQRHGQICPATVTQNTLIKDRTAPVIGFVPCTGETMPRALATAKVTLCIPGTMHPIRLLLVRGLKVVATQLRWASGLRPWLSLPPHGTKFLGRASTRTKVRYRHTYLPRSLRLSTRSTPPTIAAMTTGPMATTRSTVEKSVGSCTRRFGCSRLRTRPRGDLDRSSQSVTLAVDP